ncbi:MAG: ribonuclease Z [Spirochaetaceae bacterium]
MNMEAFVLGTGGMMPLPGRHLTSVLLRREGQLFLFDCGEGTQVSLRALNLRWKKITAIFISHTHADHVTGLPGMLMLSSQVDRDEPLYIIGPPRIREYVELSRNVLEMYINFDIVVWEIEETRRPQTVFRGEGFTVRSFPVFHTRDCIGYTLEEDRRPGVFHPERAMELGVPRGPLWSQLQQGEAVTLEEGRIVKPEEVMGQPRSGRKFSYVTDSLRHRSIEREVRGSDLLICEGMFEKALEETSHEKRHMTAADAGRLARAAGGVKRLGLIHYSPRYTRKDLKRLEQDAREEFPEAFLTKDRQTIEIPYRD